MKPGINTDMKSGTKKPSRQMKSDAGTIRVEISFGAGGTTSGTNHCIPAFIASNLAGTRTGKSRAGSTVNEYETSLQLPGTHLGIHRAATHQLFIKHCLMYHESVKLSGVPGPNRTPGWLVMCIHSLLYTATELCKHDCNQKK